MPLPRARADRVLLIVVGVGLLLRVWQYLGGTSPWLDELALTHNLTDHSLIELLTRPLDYSQVAPAGFLIVEWLLLHGLGDSELDEQLPGQCLRLRRRRSSACNCATACASCA